MKIKKLLALLLVGVFLLCAFAACDTEPAPDSSADAPASSDGNGEEASTGDSSADSPADESADDVSTPDEGSTLPSDVASAPESSSGGNSTNKPSSGGNNSTTANTTKPSSGGTTVEQMPHFNVKDYGAKANGKTDDAPAIKKAIEAAKAVNGGIVYLPAGQYLMNSGVDVPMGVTVRGENPTTKKKWRAVDDLSNTKITYESTGTAWLDAANFSGTWIIVNHGAGDVDAHATFQMEGNASIYGLGFVHKETAPITNKITVYPPAIAIKSVKEIPFVRDGMTIENINLLNAYVGIGIQAGNGKLLDHEIGADPSKYLYSLGRMRVHNVTGGCVYRGIVMKALLDTVDLQNIRFGYTNLSKTYATQRAQNCADFEWYRADGSNAANIFSFGAKYGILTTPAYTHGSTSMRLSAAELIGQYPLYATATGQYEVADCTFTTMDFNGLAKEKDFRALTIIQDATSHHQPFYLFNNCVLENKVQSASANDYNLYLVTKQPTATAMVQFSDLTFKGWSPDSTDPVIYYEATGSGYGGFALFQDCKAEGGDASSGMLYKAVNISKGGLQFNSCDFPQGLIDRSAESDTVWFQ